MAAEAKYREIERTLREDLRNGLWKAGERLPSEHELSRRFGVSYMTTRQAVSLLVADGLVRRTTGKGTFVLDAQSPVAAPLSLIVPALWQKIDPYYFPDVLDGFQDQIKSEGREVVIADYPFAERTDALAPGSAVACLLTTPEEATFAERLKDQGYAVLAINRYTGRRAIPWVAPDNVSGTLEATQRLIRHGHQRIAFLRGDLNNLDAQERLKGYRQAMRGSRLATMEAGSGFREDNGYRAAQELLRAPNPPTALVSASDLSALGALKAAREFGLGVPAQLSVIGFGNFSLLSYLDPALTTIDLPRVTLGQRAARMLLAMAAGSAVKSETIPTTFVPGLTDAAPKDLVPQL